MPEQKLRILDFDGSVSSQQELCGRFKPELIDLRDLGLSSRLWSNKRTAQEIRARLKPEEKGRITFLGSGDYHHISSLLIGQFTQPISLIVFDHHPDWDILPPKLGCGSWVTNTLRQANLSKVLLLGVSSDDISSKWIYTANLASLAGNKVRIYPYSHQPSTVIFKPVPQNDSINLRKGLFFNKITWSELKGKDLSIFFKQILDGLTEKRVYVSIDKDCLKKEYALTNWEEGKLALDELLSLINMIRENCDILGVDITGEYSTPEAAGRFKSFCSRLDHPKDFSAVGKTMEEVNAANEKTNIRILEALLK